ncbi:MAG: hypothetical protein AAGI38_24685 [Bacteroidota bacterium]
MCILAHLWVLLLVIPTEGIAQADNAAIYRDLIQQFVQEEGDTFGLIKSEPFVSLPFIQDSTNNRVLQVFPLELTYSRVTKGIFLRQAQARFQIRDSTISTRSFSYTDTLTAVQLQYVRRSSPSGLKGYNPQPFSKWGIPILTVAGSVGVLVGLFFIRSG